MGKTNKKQGEFWIYRMSIILFLLLSILAYIPASAVTSDNAIIYDIPLFDNYGPAFATWSGEAEMPLGNALLKGTVSINKDKIKPGEKIIVDLDISFSGTIIAGEDGAVMNELGYDIWMLSTEEISGENIELGSIEGSEYLGIGGGQDIPPLMLRNISHSYEVIIPEEAIPGTYEIYAFIEGTKYQTKPVTITIL